MQHKCGMVYVLLTSKQSAMDIYAIASLSFFACYSISDLGDPKFSRPTSEIRTLSDNGLHAAVIFKNNGKLLLASHDDGLLCRLSSFDLSLQH